MYKNMFLYDIKLTYLKNDYQFSDTLKTKYHKISGNCNFVKKVKFHKLEWSSPLTVSKPTGLFFTSFTFTVTLVFDDLFSKIKSGTSNILLHHNEEKLTKWVATANKK